MIKGRPVSKVVCGDVREVLRQFPDEHFHCLVTSPPYWGLRVYGIEPSLWGGYANCEHVWGNELGITNTGRRDHGSGIDSSSNLGGNSSGAIAPGPIEASQGQFCQRCGAWLGCLGLEDDPESFVRHLVEIFREVKRVMRSDGVIWVNMGDSYMGSLQGYGAINKPPFIKPLDLCNIPHAVAEALRADGWYWRQTIIWYKRSCVPESVRGWRWERCKVKVAENRPRHTGWAAKAGRNDSNVGGFGGTPWNTYRDCPGCSKCTPNGGYVLRKGSWRPTTSHEYIFMMSKMNNYFCDDNAVREEPITGYDRVDTIKTVASMGTGAGVKLSGRRKELDAKGSYQIRNNPSGRNLRSVWEIVSIPSNWEYCSGCGTLYEGENRSRIIRVEAPTTGEESEEEVDSGLFGEITVRKGKIEKVSFCSKCYKWDAWEAHFAAYPSELPRRALKASTSEAGCCPKCGAPWARVVERCSNPPEEIYTETCRPQDGYVSVNVTGKGIGQKYQDWRNEHPDITLGFRPTCTCSEADSAPMRVLDPFVGSGTTGIVAKELGLDFVGIDIKQVYVAIARARIEQAPEAVRQLKLHL